MAAQVIKRYTRRRVVGILHRVVRGTQEAAVEARLRFTQEGDEAALINAAYIERFQAAFRSRLAPQVRAEHGRRWLERTLAQAAGLTDHCWSLIELLVCAVLPTVYAVPSGAGDD